MYHKLKLHLRLFESCLIYVFVGKFPSYIGLKSAGVLGRLGQYIVRGPQFLIHGELFYFLINDPEYELSQPLGSNAFFLFHSVV